MHTVIATIEYFSNKKRHISQDGTTNSLCGKNLGFSYEVVTNDYVVSEPKEFTTEELLKMGDMCKKCLTKLNLVLPKIPLSL